MYTDEKNGVIAETLENSYENGNLNLKTLIRFVKLDRGLVPEGTEIEDIPIGDVSMDFVDSITVSEANRYIKFLKERKALDAMKAAQAEAPERAHEFTAEPIVEIFAEPVVEVAAEPLIEITEQPVAAVIEKPAVELPKPPISAFVEKPAAEVYERPVQRPAPEVYERPVQRPSIDNIERPIKRPSIDNIERPIQRPSIDNIERPIQRPSIENIERPSVPSHKKERKPLTGKPSVDRPWMKYYSNRFRNAPMPNCTMYENIYKNNRDNLDGTALNYFGKKTTYEQFFEDIDIVARSFLAYGVREGDIVTIVSLTTPIAITCLYALNKIGAVPNFVNVLSTTEEFESFFKEAQSDVIVTLDLFGSKVIRAAERFGARIVIVYSLAEGMPAATAAGFKFKVRKLDMSFMEKYIAIPWSDFIDSAEFYPQVKYRKSPDSVAYLGHTGGTTGFPKGVYLNDHAFNYVAENYNMGMKHKKGDVFLNVMIPYVIYSAIDNIHMPLSLSMEVVIIPKFDPAEWPKYIKKYQPNHCAIIPAYLAPMTTNEELKKMDLTCLRTVGMGGDGMNIPLEEAAIELFKSRSEDNFNPLVKGYGMSEVCATAVTEFSFANKVGSVGLPFPGNVVTAYNNDEQRECTYYEVGEVIMQCGSMMMGYKDNEEETENLFRTHPDGSKWVHTGDLGYIDEDGFLFIEGRMKRMIMTVIDGAVYKIFPSKVEAELSHHKDVYASCVVKANDGANQVLKAYIIPEAGRANRFDDLVRELRVRCNANLPENMRPMFYEQISDFPRTPAGKVDYRALED